MMTNRMRVDLAYAGYTQDEIDAMTPSEAWLILNGGSVPSAAPAAAPVAAVVAPVASAVVPVASVAAPVTMTPAMQLQLARAGYTQAEIAAMSPAPGADYYQCAGGSKNQELAMVRLARWGQDLAAVGLLVVGSVLVALVVVVGLACLAALAWVGAVVVYLVVLALLLALLLVLPCLLVAH